jgi:hypothetical protein
MTQRKKMKIPSYMEEVPLEEAEVLTDLHLMLGFPLPRSNSIACEFGYYLENGHVVSLGLTFEFLISEKISIPIIASLPENIGQLRYLRHLSARGNNITALPLSMQHLHQLETIDLEDNPNFALPDWIRFLPQLKSISVNTSVYPPKILEEA